MTTIQATPLSSETNLVGKIVTQELSTTGLTLYVQFQDKSTLLAREPQASTKVFTLDKGNSRAETIYADSHTTTDGITTITINANGRNILKYGYLNGSGTGNRHPLNAEVGCANIHLYNEVVGSILKGEQPTMANLLKMGDGTASDIKLEFTDNEATPSFIIKDSATGKILMSHNGVDTFDPQMGGSGVTAGDGLKEVASDFSVDTADTVIFAKANGDVAENKVPVSGATGVIPDRAMHATTDISAITSTADELNKLDGASANVTATNLNTLTGGPSTDASALHKHSSQTTTYFAYEDVTTAKAVAQLPIQCEWFAGLTSTELPLGNTNANRKRSFAFVPSQDVATVPNLSYRVCEAVNGATNVGDMTVRMETDDGTGKPSGTLVHANATYTISQATQRTAWTESEATATIIWAGAFGLTKGTKYHIVFSASGTDATNYIKLFGNATSGEYQNYLVFPQYTYSVDTTAWSAVANSYLYIWEATVPFGYGVVHTDADYAGRTFSFIGIVRTGVSAYADVEVYENEAPNQTGLIAGQNYYISATAGDITITSPANQMCVGQAKSDTKLIIKPIGRIIGTWSETTETGSGTYTKTIFTGIIPKKISAFSTGGSGAAIQGYLASSNGWYNGLTYACSYNGVEYTAAQKSVFGIKTDALAYLANDDGSTTTKSSTFTVSFTLGTCTLTKTNLAAAGIKTYMAYEIEL